MDLLLLVPAALVLVAIALWLVGPARTGEPVFSTVDAQEGTRMTRPGDQFEDQYTSATADLSAGGVAAAFANQTTEPPPATLAADAASAPLAAEVGSDESLSAPERSRQAGAIAYARGVAPRPAAGSQAVPVGVGLGVLLTLAGGLGGAWLYARWTRGRSPMRRLRRRLGR
ncbi:MAG TPA: hypothetical protein VF937_16730 [Chloroflexota bacterium]